MQVAARQIGSRILVGMVVALAAATAFAQVDPDKCECRQCPDKQICCCWGYEGCEEGSAELVENGCSWTCEGYSPGYQYCDPLMEGN